MIGYKIEPVGEAFPGQWAVIAIFGNRLEWEVARYSSRQRAQDRVDRIEEMRKAETAR